MMGIGNDENIMAPIYDYDSNRIAYLGMIQGTINRMAGNSGMMKGFAATTIAAMYGMCVIECVKWYYILTAFLEYPC